ncbi:MAG: ATP-binding protein [Mariprofundaceae bacterium]
MQSSDIQCCINSACDCIHILHAIVEVMGRRTKMCAKSTNRMMLAVDELFANICQHGYCQEQGAIEMSTRLTNDRLSFEFRDYAQPVQDVCTLQGRSFDDVKPGGLGMHLIRSVLDEFHHETLADGNRWTLVRYLDKQGG